MAECLIPSVPRPPPPYPVPPPPPPLVSSFIIAWGAACGSLMSRQVSTVRPPTPLCRQSKGEREREGDFAVGWGSCVCWGVWGGWVGGR